MKRVIQLFVAFILCITLVVNIFPSIVLADVWKTKMVYDNTYTYKTVGGYAGNQPSKGTKFPTGGGFYWSDKGGPSVSISVGIAGQLFSVGASLGNSSNGSGKFVTVPSKNYYYKLYVEKKLKIRRYRFYKQVYNNRQKKYEWELVQTGVNYTVNSVKCWAKKVG